MRHSVRMRTVLITWRPAMARVLIDWVHSRGDELVLLETTQGRPSMRGEMWKSVLDLLPFEVPGVVARHPSDAVPLIESLEPDLIVSWGFPHLIDARTIAAARVAALNIHPGRLPDYRGPNPMWAIYRGEPEIDVAVHRLASDFDTGDVLAVTTLLLDATPTPEHVFDLWSSAVGPTLDAAIARVVAGEPGWPQPRGDVDILPLFDSSHGELDWDETTRTLMCRWTACTMGGAQVTVPLDGSRRVLRGLRVVEGAATVERPGTILSSLGRDHIVAARDGLLLVEVD
jgi:methionyl-tRNA formyltransferase